jgi:hypothetical protein
MEVHNPESKSVGLNFTVFYKKLNSPKLSTKQDNVQSGDEPICTVQRDLTRKSMLIE